MEQIVNMILPYIYEGKDFRGRKRFKMAKNESGFLLIDLKVIYE
jgi:hypothetical protein